MLLLNPHNQEVLFRQQTVNLGNTFLGMKPLMEKMRWKRSGGDPSEHWRTRHSSPAGVISAQEVMVAAEGERRLYAKTPKVEESSQHQLICTKECVKKKQVGEVIVKYSEPRNERVHGQRGKNENQDMTGYKNEFRANKQEKSDRLRDERFLRPGSRGMTFLKSKKTSKVSSLT